MAGFSAARVRGHKGGRPGLPTEKIAAIQALAASRHTLAEECQVLGIGCGTFYKHVNDERQSSDCRNIRRFRANKACLF